MKGLLQWVKDIGRKIIPFNDFPNGLNIFSDVHDFLITCLKQHCGNSMVFETNLNEVAALYEAVFIVPSVWGIS